ncbi:hypothetical protein D5085_13630 [Ectothiorhodospiraceae bacterium BW-2]|nr:hypothetical protein D5085_13630 [Ectothiorhodospiraceae bacterium BW-2]
MFHLTLVSRKHVPPPLPYTIAPIVLLLSLVTPNAYGDINHYNNALLGERASGMGGSYIGISDDVSGLYYNPAGIVYSQDLTLSGAVNTYSLATTTYKNALLSNDYERETSSLLPNFFGMVQPMQSWTFGFSYAVTDSLKLDQDQLFTNLANTTTSDAIINSNFQNDEYKIGPSLAMEINDRLAVGMTLYFYLHQSQIILNQWIGKVATKDQFDDGHTRFEWSNTYIESEESGIEPVLGVMWAPIERLSIGMTLRQPLLFSSEMIQQQSCSSDREEAVGLCALANGTTQAPVLTHIDAKRDLPLHLGLGAAWFYSDKLLLSADLNHFSATSATEFDNTDRDSVTNLALGMEYYLTNSWALRSGLFSNNSNNSKLEGLFTEDIDRIGLSGSITRFTRNSSLTLGLIIEQGSGTASVIEGANQATEFLSTNLFLGSSYKF